MEGGTVYIVVFSFRCFLGWVIKKFDRAKICRDSGFGSRSCLFLWYCVDAPLRTLTFFLKKKERIPMTLELRLFIPFIAFAAE